MFHLANPVYNLLENRFYLGNNPENDHCFLIATLQGTQHCEPEPQGITAWSRGGFGVRVRTLALPPFRRVTLGWLFSPCEPPLLGHDAGTQPRGVF